MDFTYSKYLEHNPLKHVLTIVYTLVYIREKGG